MRALCLSLLLLVACGPKATMLDGIYTGLTTAEATYRSALRSAHEAHRAGAITDEQMQTVIEVARKYQRTYNLVLTASQEYIKAKRAFEATGQGGEELEDMRFRLVTLNQSVGKILREMLSVLTEFGVTP